MAKKAKTAPKKEQDLKKRVKQLEAENSKLKAEIDKKPKQPSWFSRSWRAIAIILLAGIAAAVLMLGNLFFWAGRTVVDGQRYQETIAPIIKDPEIQKAVSKYTTQQIFANNDVEGTIRNVLPPRADVLAPTIADQVNSKLEVTLNKVMANEKFQDVWVNANRRAHDRLFELANSPHGQDGMIDLNEVYQQLSIRLKDTKLAFLAGKQLPSKVGDIEVIKSDKLHYLHLLSKNINTFKYLCLFIVVLFSAGVIWIARNKRKALIKLGILYAAVMLITLIGLRIGTYAAVSKVNPDYQAAATNAAGIMLHSLRLQTITVLLLAAVISFAAWVSGPYRRASVLRARVDALLQGKAHQSLFSKENTVTLWVGKHVRALRILSLLLVVTIMLFVQLSPKAILLYVLIELILLGIIEVLAAKKT